MRSCYILLGDQHVPIPQTIDAEKLEGSRTERFMAYNDAVGCDCGTIVTSEMLRLPVPISIGGVTMTGIDLWVGDDAISKDSPVNGIASMLTGQTVRGKALMMATDDAGGSHALYGPTFSCAMQVACNCYDQVLIAYIEAFRRAGGSRPG